MFPLNLDLFLQCVFVLIVITFILTSSCIAYVAYHWNGKEEESYQTMIQYPQCQSCGGYKQKVKKTDTHVPLAHMNRMEIVDETVSPTDSRCVGWNTEQKKYAEWSNELKSDEKSTDTINWSSASNATIISNSPIKEPPKTREVNKEFESSVEFWRRRAAEAPPLICHQQSLTARGIISTRPILRAKRTLHK
ncbi:hypothetical protein M3Y98_00948400 [Aphelenchoides besseyi]|nr:hypothetical protein M3Y98_00948400 [Aphelenchoides besseyi]KAI6194540.1 hypothetical protein M3Y96_01135900 [Aphelenchoides besseyi]